MTLEPARDPLSDCGVSSPEAEDSIYMFHDYETRFGMSRDRFKLLNQSLRLTMANAPPREAGGKGGAAGGGLAAEELGGKEDTDPW